MPGYSGLYRVRPLTHLKMCVFFSALRCLPRGSSLKFHKLRYFTARGKSMSELQILVSAVRCYCQSLSRLCATNFPTQIYKYNVHLLHQLSHLHEDQMLHMSHYRNSTSPFTKSMLFCLTTTIITAVPKPDMNQGSVKTILPSFRITTPSYVFTSLQNIQSHRNLLFSNIPVTVASLAMQLSASYTT